MRIVIDARRLQDFGIGTYIRNLVRGLSVIDSKNQYVLVSNGESTAELGGLPENFEVAHFQGPSNPFLRMITFPACVRKFSPDLVHIPLNAVPPGMPHPYIVTIHDMAHLKYAKKRGLRDELKLWSFRHGLTQAARVIAVSNATRRDLMALTSLSDSRIRTIYNAPDPIFREPVQAPIACETSGPYHYPPEMQRILDRYQIHYPFLLYVGRTNPHKNIPRLVEAFAVVQGELAGNPLYQDLRLIIIGDEISGNPALRNAVRKSRIDSAVRFLGFVPIETLCVFYQSAVAFVFPSLYEGFGLPPLEAMACGTPVITSNISALPEVVGDAAWVVNPENVFDIARGVREVLLDVPLREALIRRGLEQAKRFSWKTTASEVLRTYEEVAASRR
jgi:glycosyltransferase involved in cell wall biosynthesis